MGRCCSGSESASVGQEHEQRKAMLARKAMRAQAQWASNQRLLGRDPTGMLLEY
jgi:hypothetical protein